MTVRLRPAAPLDAGTVGAIISEAVAAHDWKPVLHSGAEDIGFAGRMIDRGWVTVAEAPDGRIAGFLARHGAEIHVLFVAGFAQRGGIGTALLDHAKAGSDMLSLWAFQKNRDAQRFYTREGFVETGRTDGQGNEEGLPDIFYEWRAAAPAPQEEPPV